MGNGTVIIKILSVQRTTWDNALAFLNTQVANFNNTNTGSQAILNSNYVEQT